MARKSQNKRDGIYQRGDRAGFWISWTDAQGRRRYRKTDAQNITQARTIRSAELLRVEHARVLGFTPPGEETFKEVANRFDAHQKARLTDRAYEREHSIIEKHLKPFFACKLAAIRRVDVQRYVTKRTLKVSAHSVQKELNVLKHLLRLAVEWEIIPVNHAQGVRSPQVGAGRVRYLQPNELQLLVEASPEWLRQIVVFAVSTGMRRSEVLGLRWLDVDLLNNRVMLPQTKNGDGRIVYLNQSAQSVFQSLPINAGFKPTDKVFAGVTPDQVSVTFRRLCRKKGILDFRFHDLRHTAASWMRMQGADIHTVAQLLGHKDLRMAARYQHLSPAFLAEAVGRLDAVFGDLRYQDVTAPRAIAAASTVTC